MLRLALIQIRAIAVNVWRSSVRDRILLILWASALLFIFFSIVLAKMVIGNEDLALQTTGFWIMGIWGLISVLYLGSNIVRQEIYQKTIYFVLSRPVHRTTFLLGKFFGMVIVLASLFVILALCWLVLLLSKGVSLNAGHFVALGFIFGEWVLLASFSLFFAAFTSPLLHNFFLVGLSFLGHWSRDLYLFSQNAHSAIAKTLLSVIYHVLPNLDALNFRQAALYNEPINAGLLMLTGGVLLAWMLTALVGANLIFSRRRLL